jgi:hypothetical protein
LTMACSAIVPPLSLLSSSRSIRTHVIITMAANQLRFPCLN